MLKVFFLFAFVLINSTLAFTDPITKQVMIPDEDRFAPFALTIHIGDSVKWTNNDTDDHTVVSDDVFNTTGPVGLNHLLPGTDSNNGKPGELRIRFRHPGTFVYFRRFHTPS